MTIRKPDPVKRCYDFWKSHKWCAPESVSWENGEVHYKWMPGIHPATAGPRVMQTLRKLWSESRGKVDLAQYLRHMREQLPPESFELLAKLRDLTPALNVHGNCLLSNIVFGKERTILLKPGETYGLFCREVDEAKLLQSMRGWEKPLLIGNSHPLPNNLNVLILYMANLYCELRKPHQVWVTLWIKTELANVHTAIDNLLA